MYAGLGADTLATVLSSFIYFYCYTALRNVQEKFNKNLGNEAKLNVAQELFLGAEAALISRFFTTPVSNVTTRLQTASSKEEYKKGFMDVVSDIYKEKGITGFWTGYRASILLVSNPSITYFVFEKAKAFYLKAYKKTVLGPLEVFFLSALSKTVATMVTYPIIFTRTNMVASKNKNDESEETKGKGKLVQDKKEGMIALINHVIQRDGVFGLYKVIYCFLCRIMNFLLCSGLKRREKKKKVYYYHITY